MSDTNKALFLSYASQDADAARKICEALRAAGVEVWFDQSELRGGDAWDQKIRRQIKECALFVPVISANTQARREGYFRLEWKLADDRTHLMARGTPFVVPVCIDDTKDWDALVPDSFTVVQWTRLPAGETTPLFAGRVLALLAEHPPQNARPVAGDSREARPGSPVRETKIRWTIPVLVFVAAAVGLGIWWLSRNTNPAGPARIAAAQAGTEASRLAQRALATTRTIGFTRDDLAVAQDLTRRATELEPDLALAWAARAWVEAAYINRTWDRSAKRREDTQLFANRALALDRNQPDALNALAVVLMAQGAFAAAEPLARQAIAAAPENVRSRLLIAAALFSQGRSEESHRVLLEALQRDPANGLVHYELAGEFTGSWDPIGVGGDRYRATLEQFDRVLATQPFGSAFILKARLAVAWDGDLVEMRKMLDRLEQMPVADRAEDRAVYIAAWGALLERQPARVAAAVALTARTYFEDAPVASPKAWLSALAQQVAGKDTLARMEWQTAETVLRQRIQAAPGDRREEAQLAITLAWLGKNVEAARAIAPYEAAAQERNLLPEARQLALYYGARGEATKAASYLKRALNRNLFVTPHTLRLDPWWDKLRGQPEFEELLRVDDGVRGKTAAARAIAPDPKSLAVLPFANLSADSGSAEFTDGMHDEVLMAVGKVSGLKVIGRTSVLKYADAKNRDLRAIAADLGVSSVIEGTVRRLGNRVRIAVSLVNASDARQLWGDSFDGELTDAFAIQASIAERVAGTLKITLTSGERAELARQPTANADAYALYLQAVADWRRLGVPARAKRGKLEEIIALCEKAVVADPRFVRAHAQLAMLHAMLFWFGDFDPAPERAARAEAAAARVRELAPESPEARLVMAHITYRCRHDWKAALEHYRAAAEMLPNDTDPRTGMANSLRRLGRWDEAIAVWREVLSLDPDALNDAQSLVESLISMRRYDDALATTEYLLVRRPGSPTLQSFRAQARFALGGSLEAYMHELEPILPKLEGYSRLPAFHALVHAKRFADADAMLARSGATFTGPGGVVASPVAQNRAFLRHLQGDRDGARALAREARPYFEREGTPRQRATLAAELAVCHALAGDAKASVAAADRSRALLRAMPDATVEAEVRFLWVKAALVRGDKVTALEELEVAVRAVFPSDFTTADLRHDLLWAALRGEPEFQQALARAEPL